MIRRSASFMVVIIALAGSALAQKEVKRPATDQGAKPSSGQRDAATSPPSTSRSNTQHNIVISIPALLPKPAKAESLSYDVSPRDLASGQDVARRPTGRTIKIMKDIDEASPLLAKAAASGKPLPSVVIEFSRPDGAGRQKVYQVVNLTDVLVSSIAKRKVGELPAEEITLTFQKIVYENMDGNKTASDSWDK